jgi:cobalamin biosynthesis Mg chelatase CobN
MSYIRVTNSADQGSDITYSSSQTFGSTNTESKQVVHNTDKTNSVVRGNGQKEDKNSTNINKSQNINNSQNNKNSIILGSILGLTLVVLIIFILYKKGIILKKIE